MQVTDSQEMALTEEQIAEGITEHWYVCVEGTRHSPLGVNADRPYFDFRDCRRYWKQDGEWEYT